MSKDYYKTLGVEKNASQDDIKKAFRKLAHQYHPDKQGGNAEKFKEVNEAYGVLSDDKKRAQYDQFGSAGPGGFGGGGAGFNPNDFGFDFSGFQQGGNVDFDLNDIFGSIFGGGRQRVRRGRDMQIDMDLTFEESIFGVKKDIHFRKGLSVDFPPGLETGQTIRLSGAGEPMEGGQPGDLYIRIHVKKHPLFYKEGNNLVTDLNVKLTDALVGASYTLKTLDGDIILKIPEGVSHGEILRVKGKGVPVTKSHRGDILVRINVTMPKRLSKAVKKAIEELKKEGL
jgi:DnaJ-class molecular chaperone